MNATASVKDVEAHWRRFAERFALLDSPLRPCAEDIRIIEEMLAAEPEVFGAGSKKRVWLLGVTPEIATARWPLEVELIAVERVQAMIEFVWPGDTDRRKAICADWLDVPLPDQSVDLAIGDGCLTAVGFPDDLSRLLASVHRCLRPGGYLLMRLFCRPDVAETPDSVIAELQSGAIGGFHAFKWRLAMALQGKDNASDVAVDDIWRAWNAARIDMRALAAARDWPLEQVALIEYYKGSAARYNFMRYDDTILLLKRAGFVLMATRTGSYELAECCPHVLLKKQVVVAGSGLS